MGHRFVGHLVCGRHFPAEWLRGAQASVDGMTLLQAPPAPNGTRPVGSSECPRAKSLTSGGEHQHPQGKNKTRMAKTLGSGFSMANRKSKTLPVWAAA
jgi:hypothetical protein